jgi:hypothetical protein
MAFMMHGRVIRKRVAFTCGNGLHGITGAPHAAADQPAGVAERSRLREVRSL